jgi:hypothetical protein
MDGTADGDENICVCDCCLSRLNYDSGRRGSGSEELKLKVEL